MYLMCATGDARRLHVALMARPAGAAGPHHRLHHHQGSSSFRYAFLPPGASSIILSPPDILTPGAEPRGEFAAFHEIDQYFPLSYARFPKYVVHMAHRDEYVSSPTFESGKPQAEKYQLYNAHVIAKMERLKPMVQEAFRIYYLSRSVRSHHHSQQVHHRPAQRSQYTA